MIVYLTEPGSVLRKKNGKLVVEKGGEKITEIPAEKVKAVASFTGTSVTAPVLDELLYKGAPLFRLSANGKCIGYLESVEAYNTEKQALQFEMCKNEAFCLSLSKKVITGKVANMLTVLDRLSDIYKKTLNEGNFIVPYIAKIEAADSISQLLGYEGIASKYFLDAFSAVIRDEFHFSGRSRKPALDPFNSLLNFAFFIFSNELYIALKSLGFTPYVGFLHKLRNRHSALASDLLEEWRALIMERVMILINGGVFNLSDFETEPASGGVYLTRNAARLFIKNFEGFLEKEDYFIPHKKACGIRNALTYQLSSLSAAYEKNDPNEYISVVAGKYMVA